MDKETVNQVLSYIEQHICERILLQDLANLAGYTPFYFSKLFSQIMGVSVTTYIRIRKLQYAMKSLSEGEKIVDISFQYAFESHESFTRSFTKLFGSNPKTVRKYMITYTVPEYTVPVMEKRKEKNGMKITKNMFEDMHSILFEFLKASIEEAKAGYCTKLYIELLEDNQIRILDNGRGLPLVNSNEENQKIVSNILAGHPITQLDYKRMEEFKELGLQVACSLCEMLKVLVYKEDMVYMQEFVRGIAQHDIHCEGTKNRTGMEIVLLPDREIFGEICFSEEKIKQWVAEVLKEVSGLEVIICQCQ